MKHPEPPKVKFKDLREGSDEKKLLWTLFRVFAQERLSGITQLNDLPLEAKIESIINLADNGIIKPWADDEGFGMGLWDFEKGEYKDL